MILIADSGSTKCDWMLIDANKNIKRKIRTQGLNPLLLNTSQIKDVLYQSKDLANINLKIKTVLFYGAGCGAYNTKAPLLQLFSTFFPNAKVLIEEDLIAAVHGSTKEPAVVCILGTGSNCCFFDGNRIHTKQASLGYMVMDECSGNYFGKKLLNTYFYNKMPSELSKKFEQEFDLTVIEVLKNLYDKKNPSAYLASFTPFLIQNKNNSFLNKIIVDGIQELFNNLINCYKEELRTNFLHFVGSIAFYLQEDILKEANQRSIKVTSFVKRPIDNIINNIEVLSS